MKNMIDLERDLITKMFQADLDIARSMVNIGNLERARAALDSALNKISQLESLSQTSPARPSSPTPTAIDI